MKDNLPDNTVDLFYVANKLVEILEVNDKELRKEVEEFKQEIFHNIGANALHVHNNQEKELSKFKDWVMEMQDDAMDMKLHEFVDKHGEVNIDIWRDVNDPFYEKPIIYDPI